MQKVNIAYFGDRVIILNGVLKNKMTLISGYPFQELIVTQLVTNSSVLYENPKLIFSKPYSGPYLEPENSVNFLKNYINITSSRRLVLPHFCFQVFSKTIFGHV